MNNKVLCPKHLEDIISSRAKVIKNCQIKKAGVKGSPAFFC
ncbi:hypothetical protein GMMP15_1510003 [Candidatus Magnetomoraceae bacterium gMMP-15]